MGARVEKQADGTYSVFDGDRLLAAGKTNSEAWRIADRFEGDPTSPAEKRSDFIASKILRGE